MPLHSDSEKLRDLQKVLEISRSMVAESDLVGLLNLIVQRGIELLDAERGTVFLYDAAGDQLVSRIATGTGELRIPADKGIAGAAVKTGAIINVPDAYADARFNPDVDRRTGFLTRNILALPLRDHRGQLVGVLQLLNKRSGPFGEYDIFLAETLGAQAGVALQRASLIEHYIQKQQMERAMRLAREIQQNLFPKAAPRVDGFDIAGFCQPADETGGDMFDFLQLSDGRWMIVVADATGHGVGPALVIAETRAMLRAVSVSGFRDVSIVLRTVNDLLSADMDGGRFVTCFFGVLDSASASLSYASAGHGPLLFYSREQDSFREVAATGLPLGIMDGMDFGRPVNHSLAGGDMAIVTTDGFFEAENAAGEPFGTGRMTDIIRRYRDEPAAAIIEKLHSEVEAFTAGAPQADDLTAVIIRKK